MMPIRTPWTTPLCAHSMIRRPKARASAPIAVKRTMRAAPVMASIFLRGYCRGGGGHDEGRERKGRRRDGRYNQRPYGVALHLGFDIADAPCRQVSGEAMFAGWAKDHVHQQATQARFQWTSPRNKASRNAAENARSSDDKKVVTERREEERRTRMPSRSKPGPPSSQKNRNSACAKLCIRDIRYSSAANLRNRTLDRLYVLSKRTANLPVVAKKGPSPFPPSNRVPRKRERPPRRPPLSLREDGIRVRNRQDHFDGRPAQRLGAEVAMLRRLFA